MAARNQGHPTTSWYAQTANPFPDLASLKGEYRTEVCIIGAGYTGLGAALRLAEQGVSTIVLEEAQVGSGASGRNGGQIHTGQRRDQYWLEKTVGPDDAMALWTLAQDAKAHLHGLIAQHAIACDLKPGLIEARHRPIGEDHDRAWRDHMASRYGYDQIRLIKQLIEIEKLDEKRWPARQLAHQIDNWKNRGLDPSRVPAGEAAGFAVR